MIETDRYVAGKRAVLEALSTGLVEKIHVSYGVAEGDVMLDMRRAAHKYKVPLAVMDKRKFRSLEQSLGLSTHQSQGVIALRHVSPPVKLDDVLERIQDAQDPPIFLALDGVTDPQNLGAIARAAEGAGCKFIIAAQSNVAPVTPVAVKASAGALEHLSVVRVDRISRALAALREAGCKVIGLADKAEVLFDTADYSGPVCLVAGAEGEGIHHRVLEQCDQIVSIPMYGNVASLNVSVASGIVLYHIRRQHRK